MAANSLYRVVIRMLFDPAFTRAVYDAREVALAGEPLTAEERSWLVAPDPRAYRTDPLRRSRALSGLMEEFPTACAFVLRRGREGARRPESELLDAFFSSDLFHQCVRDGGSMVFAFADFLRQPVHAGVPADARVAPLVELETEIARLRRLDPPAPRTPLGGDPGRLVLAGWARLLTLPAGTHELHRRVGKALVAHDRQLLGSLLDARWSLPVLLELDGTASDHLLVERPPVAGSDWTDVAVRYAPITDELFHLLEVAACGAGRAELEARARELGAGAGEEVGIIGGLIDEGLLVAAAAP